MVTSVWWRRTLVSFIITIFRNCMKVIPEMRHLHYLPYLRFLCIYQMYTLFWQPTQLPIFSMFKAYMYLGFCCCTGIVVLLSCNNQNEQKIHSTDLHIYKSSNISNIFVYFQLWRTHSLMLILECWNLYNIIRKISGQVNWFVLKLQLNNCPLLV